MKKAIQQALICPMCHGGLALEPSAPGASFVVTLATPAAPRAPEEEEERS